MNPHDAIILTSRSPDAPFHIFWEDTDQLCILYSIPGQNNVIPSYRVSSARRSQETIIIPCTLRFYFSLHPPSLRMHFARKITNFPITFFFIRWRGSYLGVMVFIDHFEKQKEIFFIGYDWDINKIFHDMVGQNWVSKYSIWIPLFIYT